MDTGTRRELVDSEYAARRNDCESAAATIGVAALRDASLDQLELIGDERVRRRARHVIGENQRTLDTVAAMRAEDEGELGRLMDARHASLRVDFDVSGTALDHIVALARQTPGCLGARMTGGGFAGAAIALVHSDATITFIADLMRTFEAPAEQPSISPVELYPCAPHRRFGPEITSVTPNRPYFVDLASQMMDRCG